MTSMYTMSEARAHLAQLLDEVERGVDVVITRNGRPVARLMPPRPASSRAAAMLREVDAFVEELSKPRSGVLPAVVEGGPSADELVAALRADRDSW